MSISLLLGSILAPPSSALAADAVDIQIFSPAPNASVGGVVVFSAAIDGWATSRYTMTWRVDGGHENVMTNGTGYPVKISTVGVAGWSWKGRGPYPITFSAYSNDNQLLGTKTVQMYVGSGTSGPSSDVQPQTQTSSSSSAAAAPAPTSTPSPANMRLEVWWPSANATLSGTQPIKAALVDLDVNAYKIFVKVDDKAETELPTKSGTSDKEMLADTKTWGNGTHTLRFRGVYGSQEAAKTVQVNVSNATATHPSPSPAPVPAPTPAPAPAPTPPPPSPTPAAPPPVAALPAIQIWWPTNGVTVSGTQQLKAVLASTSLSQYEMFWSVDGGPETSMYNSNTEAPHKEATINMTPWTWKGNGPYDLTVRARYKEQDVRSTIRITVGQSVTPTPTPPPPAPTPVTPPPPTPVAGNPLSGATFYIEPNSPAKQQADGWRGSRPADASQMEKIAAQSQARWFGGWNWDLEGDVRGYTTAATGAGQIPVLVAYNIPQRDCGGYSAGGVGSPDAYKTWIRNFARGIGNRKAVVVLEPDATVSISCLSESDKQARYGLLADAVGVLKAQGNTSVYIDAGHAGWVPASDISARLKQSGIQQADGFSLNVSNFVRTEDNVNYGQQISSQVGGKHFVVDTGRNGLGPTPDYQWCNPSGRALGPKPTTSTGNPLVDAYLWVKKPGESDGNCNGGPSAGQWWADYALGLAQKAGW